MALSSSKEQNKNNDRNDGNDNNNNNNNNSSSSSISSLASSLPPVIGLTCLSDEPSNQHDWKSLVMARVALWGADADDADADADAGADVDHNNNDNNGKEERKPKKENLNDIDDDDDDDHGHDKLNSKNNQKKKKKRKVAVQAISWQTRDGSQSGSACGAVRKVPQFRSKVQQSFCDIQQPMGYVTKIEGYHHVVGSDCLLHSLTLQYASGQVIELIGTKDEWKGEAFCVDDLPENFYLSELVFDNGMCIGYKGYSTNQDLCRVFDQEPPLTEEELALFNQADHDDDDDDDEDESFSFEENDGTATATTRKNNTSRTKPRIDPKYDNDANMDEWINVDLPARTIQPNTAATTTNNSNTKDLLEQYLWSHVCLCGGWAVRGVLFHFYDGHRAGILQDNEQRPIPNIYQNLMDYAGSEFIEVQQPGGRLVKISGHKMMMTTNENDAMALPDDHPINNTSMHDVPPYLCHSLQLEFESGQIIECQGNHNDWKGKYFEWSMPDDYYVTELHFRQGIGRPTAVSGISTTELEGLDINDLVLPTIQNRKPSSRHRNGKGGNGGRNCCSCLS